MTSDGTPAPTETQAERRATIAAEIARGAAERLAFFSDAVVAIAITLLAIELPVPEGDTDREFWHSMGQESFAYITFLISFIAIANHWAAHHRVFRYVARSDRPLVVLNLGWLLLIVLTPFLTQVVREGNELTWTRFGMYALAQGLLLLVLSVMIARMSSRDMFIEGTPETLSRRGWVGTALSGSGFLLSIPLFPLMHQWAFVVWVVVPLILSQLVVRMGWVPRPQRGEQD